jgi:hypothetical protein
MPNVSTGVAANRKDAEATLAKYQARLHKNYGDRAAYRSPYGWLIVTPQAGGKYKFELHTTQKCPCEA